MTLWIGVRDTVVRFWTWLLSDPSDGTNHAESYRTAADLHVALSALRADVDALAASITADVDRIDGEIADLKSRGFGS